MFNGELSQELCGLGKFLALLLLPLVKQAHFVEIRQLLLDVLGGNRELNIRLIPQSKCLKFTKILTGISPKFYCPCAQFSAEFFFTPMAVS